VSESFLVSVKAQDHRSDPEMNFFVELYSTGAAATRAVFTHDILNALCKNSHGMHGICSQGSDLSL
jgi:hypothetical protein